MAFQLNSKSTGNGSHKGVLRAIAYLPNGLRELLGTDDIADLISQGVPTDDDEGMTFQVGANVTLEIRPFAKAVILTDTTRVDNTCTVSYEGGFRDDDVDRLVGWYTLAQREGTDTAMHLATRLGTKLGTKLGSPAGATI